MEAFYKDNHNTIYCLDFRKNELPDECVQCVVTSPPYWGLRKYSGEQELIWGDNNCEHQWNIQKISLLHENRNFQTGTQEEVLATGSPLRHTHKTSELRAGFCSLCGAWKGAYGLEPTPEMYVQHTIEILREIRRLLRKDGVVFWNIGDSYNSAWSGYGEWTGEKARQGDGEFKKKGMTRTGIKHKTIKPKDLCLIPFRLAIAAQEDGWWVRSVIIWSKPNPMPESVRDRPTESHEYILMLTKSKKYYWDLEAVREPYSPTERWGGDIYKGAVKKGLEGEDAGLDRERSCFPNTGRNIRTVWEFPTQPYPEAHFAVFPEKLPEICIKAATPEVGCCSKCGAPWERMVERPSMRERPLRTVAKQDGQRIHSGFDGYPQSAGQEWQKWRDENPDKTLGWRPTCKCEGASPLPSLVLDPFLGAGTTLWVAKKLNRQAVGYEISQEYCQLAVDRCWQQVLI